MGAAARPAGGPIGNGSAGPRKSAGRFLFPNFIYGPRRGTSIGDRPRDCAMNIAPRSRPQSQSRIAAKRPDSNRLAVTSVCRCRRALDFQYLGACRWAIRNLYCSLPGGRARHDALRNRGRLRLRWLNEHTEVRICRSRRMHHHGGHQFGEGRHWKSLATVSGSQSYTLSRAGPNVNFWSSPASPPA